MRYQYKKPRINLNYWIVKSEDIKELYNFFSNRFPNSNIEINLETASGHNRTYENFEEYLKDIPKILADSEKITSISISERNTTKIHIYKQIWIQINFGEYCDASFHVISGDTDGSYKDWVEGSYAELNKLKRKFEITNKETIQILNKKYNKIIFDPNNEIYTQIKESIKANQRTTDKITPHKKWYQKGIFTKFLLPIVIALFAGYILYLFGWN